MKIIVELVTGGKKMNKDYVLLSSIKQFGEVPGKKALHKILYFANLQLKFFIFGWRNWGPYSEEIQQFYDDAYLENTINVNEEILQNSSIQYNIQLDKKGKHILSKLEASNEVDHDKIDTAIKFSYNLLHEKTPRQMELLASVHYISSRDSNLGAHQVWEIINRLKPKANFSEDDVNKAISELNQHQLLV